MHTSWFIGQTAGRDSLFAVTIPDSEQW